MFPEVATFNGISLSDVSLIACVGVFQFFSLKTEIKLNYFFKISKKFLFTSRDRLNLKKASKGSKVDTETH